jgi:hypothetical protein
MRANKADAATAKVLALALKMTDGDPIRDH